MFNVLARKARLTFYVDPFGRLQIADQSLDADGVPTDEVPVENLRLLSGARQLIGLHHELHHPLENGNVAADTELIEPRTDLRRGQRRHFNWTLRMLKTFEGSLS